MTEREPTNKEPALVTWEAWARAALGPTHGVALATFAFSVVALLFGFAEPATIAIRLSAALVAAYWLGAMLFGYLAVGITYLRFRRMVRRVLKSERKGKC